jgi:transitional endoplasmic reticulum ATPase
MKNGLRLAALYSPSVIFCEDIDKAVEGSRTQAMNDILNTFDGIDTKTTPIISVLTTNHIERIEKAFLRAGRIDSLVLLGALTEKTAAQFIKRFCVNSEGKSLLDPKEDYTEAAKRMNGIVPAFASGVIDKAKMYAMYRQEGDLQYINSNDLITACDSYKEHNEIAAGKPSYTEEHILGETVKQAFGLVTKIK